MPIRSVLRSTVALVVGGAAVVSGSASPANAGSVVIKGAGSTWSFIAVDQWRADVSKFGLNVIFNGVGSTAGRNFYIQKQVDFAVSEIPFQAAYKDPTGTVVSNEIDQVTKAGRPFAYLPIVAGGTSFMYHLKVGGTRITNIHLTPDTIAKMFTGVITKWNDPAIVASNPGVALPPTAVKPVIRGDGSGTSAQFTAFMADQTPSVWNAFCAKLGIATPCAATSLYPQFPGSTSRNLSDGVADFVSASYSDGAITYVEYAYAKNRRFPVASVQNHAGQFTQPTAFNVTSALRGATLNPDNTQNLGGVYNNGDPATYPVSSYSYMIVPTSTAAPFDAAKGNVLGKFITYFVCAGQQEAEGLGYAPMPKNLVVAAFNSEAKIPGADPPPPIDYAHCANPLLAGNGPQPPSSTTAPNTTKTTLNVTGTTNPQTGATDPQTGKTLRPTGVTDPRTGNTIAQTLVTDPQTHDTVLGADNQPISKEYIPIAATTAISPPNDDGPIAPGIVVAAILGLLALVFTPPIVAHRLARKRVTTE